jgi:MFS transporter, DHA1 family, inner membrane transport protein
VSAATSTQPHADTLDRPTLARLTGAKAMANTALRWIPPFLPTLERAFGVSTTQLTTVLGFGEAAGLSTMVIGKQLDRGRERPVMIGGLSAISLSSVIALGGSIWTFAIAFTMLILGVANFTVGGHAWISHSVHYSRRARSIGIFETSWAFALLIGGPIVAVLINLWGWRAPFVFMAVGCAIAAVVVALTLPAAGPATTQPESAATGATRLTRRAWLVVIGSATMAMAGLSVFMISGSWLNDEFGVSTGGLGFIVMGFGAFELIASAGSAALADRIGKMRSTLGGLVVLACGLLVMLSAGDRLVIGVIGILMLLIGFEYGFVTTLSLVSEAMPEARGSTLAVGNAIGTLARGSGVILSGWLYGIHGIAGTAALSATAAAIAATCFVLSRQV